MTSTNVAAKARKRTTAEAASPTAALPAVPAPASPATRVGKGRRAASAASVAAASREPPPSIDTPKGKLGVMVELLRRPEGARLPELCQATGWLTHSVRGAMSGALKTRGYAITSTPDAGGRIYCIAPAEEASA